jgi:hypothetical protein
LLLFLFRYVSDLSFFVPRFLVESVLPIFLVFCVVLLCVFTLGVPCCNGCYNFRIKTMFGSSLPFACRWAHVLFALCVFVCTWWCLTHIVQWLCFAFLRLVYPMLPVPLFLFWLPFRYSLTFIFTCFCHLGSSNCLTWCFFPSVFISFYFPPCSDDDLISFCLTFSVMRYGEGKSW